MELITEQQLKAIMPKAGVTRIRKYISYINQTFLEFGISTPIRKAHFLAQVAHESGEMRYTKELASGKAYEGRKDLGNTVKGYGVKYKGRGFLQVTGFYNYKAYKQYCGFDVVARPELLEQPRGAVRSAGWVFTKALGVNLNMYAELDNGENTEEVLKKITKKINGGYNGLASRRTYLKRAKEVLL